MPLYLRERTLLFKTETVSGTDAVPTGAVNAIMATDIVVSPMEGQDVSRDLELPWMGAQGTRVGGRHSKLTFKVELKGSGAAGTPPVLGPLLRACGMAEVIVAVTSVTYSKTTSNHSSATIYFNQSGTLYKFLGSKGNATLRVNAQGIVYAEFEFWGLYVQPAAQAVPAVTLAAQLTAFPLIASSGNTPVFTIGGVPHALRTFALMFGNTVEPRLLIGSEEIIIASMSEMIEATINAVPLVTLDPYALAISGATQAVVLQHGTVAGNIFTTNAPRGQFMRPGSPSESQGIVEQALRITPLPNTGNDQFTLAFT